MNKALIARNVMQSVEPAVRHLADRIFVLTGGRVGSQRRKPTIATFFETGIVVAIYEFLLMNPAWRISRLRTSGRTLERRDPSKWTFDPGTDRWSRGSSLRPAISRRRRSRTM